MVSEIKLQKITRKKSSPIRATVKKTYCGHRLMLANFWIVFSLLALASSNALSQDRICDIKTDGSEWSCPFELPTTSPKKDAASRLESRILMLEADLKNSKTEEEVFSVLKVEYTQLGNLIDFEAWLRNQGFSVGRSRSPAGGLEGLHLMFPSSEWRLFESFWLKLTRWTAQTAVIGIGINFDKSGQMTAIYSYIQD